MKYDPNFPLKLNTHVIIDRRSGAQSFSTEHSPILAMREILEQVTEGDFKSLSTEHQKQLTDFMGKIVMAKLTQRKPDFPDVLAVGPYETQNRCSHMKNMMLVENITRQTDPELADWLTEELLVDHEDDDMIHVAGPQDPIGAALQSAFSNIFGDNVKVVEVKAGGSGLGGLDDLLSSLRGFNPKKPH